MGEMGPINNIDAELNKGYENFKKELENDFKEINDTVKENPDKINKINEDVKNNFDKYLETHPGKVNETLINTLDALKDPNDQLDRRDKKSLEDLKDICLKHTSMEKVGEYQINNDVFNTDFDFGKLKGYGELFQKGNTSDWFKNIPEKYDGKNENINKLFSEGAFKGKYFSPDQFVKGLFEKNKNRSEKLVKDLNNYDIISFITNNNLNGNQVEELKKGNTDVYKNFPSMEGYWEFNDLANDEKTNGFLKEWNKKIDEKTTMKEVTITADKLFTKDEILNKYNGDDKNNVINFNKNSDWFDDTLDVVKKNGTDLKKNELIKLLNSGDLKEFQRKIYGDKLNDSKFKDDGKFGKETYEMTARYLSEPLGKMKTISSTIISTPPELNNIKDAQPTLEGYNPNPGGKEVSLNSNNTGFDRTSPVRGNNIKKEGSFEKPNNKKEIKDPNSEKEGLNGIIADKQITAKAETSTETLKGIEKKFTDLGYEFKLDQDKGVIKVNWPQGKDIREIKDETIIGKSTDQMTSIIKLDSQMKGLFEGVGRVLNIENKQTKTPDNVYKTRANSITISI